LNPTGGNVSAKTAILSGKHVGMMAAGFMTGAVIDVDGGTLLV
jgi:hypothetical protein